MNILTAYDAFSGCSWYRGVVPAHYASTIGHHARVAAAQASKSDIEWCDVLQVQRLVMPGGSVPLIRDTQALGKRVVYDIDDDVWALRRSNPSWEFWRDHKADALRIMQMCDVVTTTGEDLAATLREHHGDVRIIPNALPMDFHRYGGDHTPPLVIGWAGGNSHRDDLNIIKSVLLEVLDNRPNVVAALAGCGEHIQHPRVIHLNAVVIEHYHKLLSTFDIGLAPLVDDRFNRAKSDLKPLEYAAVGIPCIASPVGPYRDLDRGVLLASKLSDWRRHLYRLIAAAEERQALADEGLAWADTRRIDKMLPLWMNAWQE